MNLHDALHRRDLLRLSAGGLGLHAALSRAVAEDGGGPLAPRVGHFAPNAKHLIVVFLTGGMSHVDTFDPKPKLRADQGKTVSAVHLRGKDALPLLGSPFEFRRCGNPGWR